MNEIDRVFFGVAAERTDVTTGGNAPLSFTSYCLKVNCPVVSFPLTLGWLRDTRDSVIAPTRGILTRVYSEVVPTGAAQYVRYGSSYQHFVPITKAFSMAFNADLGLGQPLGNGTFPVYKNYYAGGLGSVRGYAQGTLGPRDVTGVVVGGPKRLVLNGEVFAPFPGAGNDKSLRLYGFVDAGNVFAQDEPIQFKDLRSAYGLGLSWLSPMGPLRFALANPINKQSGDRINRVQFQIGNAF
jgi:outer membrane protein insertion porin family